MQQRATLILYGMLLGVALMGITEGLTPFGMFLLTVISVTAFVLGWELRRPE